MDVPGVVIVGEAARGIAISWQYQSERMTLFIGLFIYFRRGSAYKARHFYIFCLVSFIFSCFHRTGKLNAFDQVITGETSSGMARARFISAFCLTFPEPRSWLAGWMTADLRARRGFDPGGRGLSPRAC